MDCEYVRVPDFSSSSYDGGRSSSASMDDFSGESRNSLTSSFSPEVKDAALSLVPLLSSGPDERKTFATGLFAIDLCSAGGGGGKGGAPARSVLCEF
ncbi:hypothetical protein OGATHE_003956 [Ogataea polymorpha]|uniref:Uncharacterized protein n=1 Tax=Ogataea polymorpha TaxID=460523 RepID=A0A9P8P4Y3_9ASCO|nr:hypothetical protein OGATHE_003956 [Ogataea polymorpha]